MRAAKLLTAVVLTISAFCMSGSVPGLAANIAKTSAKVCAQPAASGSARCLAERRTDAAAVGRSPARGRRPVAQPNVLGNGGAYDPAFLQSAYNLAGASASRGAGVTIAIVDAYDSPTAESDMDLYRSHFGLPPCPAGSCFTKVDQSGSTGYPTADPGWAQEISLDLDMASAMCPLCNILLVEASSNYFSDLGTAVNTAARLGAAAISNSYGGSEWSNELSYDTEYYNHPGIAVTASTGDKGYGVQYPAASRYVTAVGGTTLNQLTNTGSRNATETAWSSAGSGCSAYESKPSWQSDSGCARRSLADVSAVADPNTGVWVYYSGAWYVFGGTSVASPIIASIYALNGKQAIDGASTAYANATALNDVTSGSNGPCGTYLCTAGTGYDGPTGLGTPNGTGAFAPAPDFSIGVGPSNQSVVTGANATYTVTLTPTNGFSASVTLSLSGQPADAVYSFAPAIVSVGSTNATSTLAISTGTPGTYLLTVSASAGSLAHSAAATLTTSTPDFTVSASPSSVAVAPGGAASYTLALTPVAGFSGAVDLAVSGAPPDSTPTFSVNPVTLTFPNASMSTLTLTSATPGTYSLMITATSGALSHATPVTLVVNAPKPDFTISVSPSSRVVARGGSTSYLVTIMPSNGFNGAVSLNVSGLPSRTTASFSPNPASASSTLAISTTRKTSGGSYLLTITASGGGLTHTGTATLIVQ